MALKREFLKTVVEGITDEQLDKIMAEVGKTETAHNNTIAAKDADIAAKTTTINTLNAQLQVRDADIEKLKQDKGADAELQKKLDELQSKYDSETKALNEQLTSQAQQHETERLFAGIEFTSDYAKQGAMAAFKEKKYRWDGKTFEGAEAFIDTLKKDAKAVVQPEPQSDEGNGSGNDDSQQQEPKPNFAKGASGNGQSGSKPIFDFSSGFNFLRKPPEAK